MSRRDIQSEQTGYGVRLVTKGAAVEEELRKAIRTAFAALPVDFAVRYKVAQEMSHVFHQELAAGLQSAFAEFVASIAIHADDVEAKRDVASNINALLRDIHLGVREQHRETTGIIVADVKDSQNTSGRFRVEGRGNDGRRYRSSGFNSLSQLNLVLAEQRPRREGLSRIAQGTTEAWSR